MADLITSLDFQMDQLYNAAHRVVDTVMPHDLLYAHGLHHAMAETFFKALVLPVEEMQLKPYQVEYGLVKGLLMGMFSGHYKSVSLDFINQEHSKLGQLVDEILCEKRSYESLYRQTAELAQLGLEAQMGVVLDPHCPVLGRQKVWHGIQEVHDRRLSRRPE